MKKNYINMGIILFVLTIAFGAMSVFITKSEIQAVEASLETSSETGTEDDTTNDESTSETTEAVDQKAAATALIDETLSRDEIEAAVGSCVKFEMSSNGCERGVYAGRFYYNDFNIYTRTYDLGDTFIVISINE